MTTPATRPVPDPPRKVPISECEFPHGMTVGHWRVIGPRELGFDKKHYFHKCVSRCGVISPVRVSDLRTGRPLTCEGCREGYSPPPESRFMSYTGDWSLLMAVELINTFPKNSDRFAEWPASLKLLENLLATTALGANFGWRAYANCGHRHKKARESAVRILNETPSDRKVTLRTRAAGSHVQFDVSLMWSRTDVPAAQVISHLRTMCLSSGGREEEDDTVALAEPAEKVPEERSPKEDAVVPAVAARTTFSHTAGLETKLEKMKSGIDHMIALNRDMGALEELKADAIAREHAAAQSVTGPRDEYNRLSAREKEAAEDCRALARQADELRERLKRTEAALEEASTTLDAVTTDMRAAQVIYHPLQAAYDEARANLRQVEASERERAAEMAKVPDLAALLAAFERMG